MWASRRFMYLLFVMFFFFFKQKTAYEMVSDWSSDVCSSDLDVPDLPRQAAVGECGLRGLYLRGRDRAEVSREPEQGGAMSIIRPLSPDDVDDARSATIPSEVIEIFNGLIAANWNGSSATVQQDEAAQAIAEKMGITTGEAFKRGLLDVESIY